MSTLTSSHVASRRRLLAGLAAMLGFSSVSARISQCFSDVGTRPDQNTQEIAPGVYVHTGHQALAGADNGGDIANLGFIIGNERIAVIDTGGSFKVGAKLLDEIRRVSDKPIGFVINTHMHPDHVLGNAAFESARPQFVGHHKLGRALAARADVYVRANRENLGDAAFAGTKIIPPTLTVEGVIELDLGQRKLLVEAQPTAHTDNDVTIFDPATRTLLLGDLLFSGHIPALDGSIKGWLAVLEKLRTGVKADRVVPGHGPAAMAWPSALDPQRKYLETVVTEVRQYIKDGKTLAEAAETAARSERPNWQLFDEFHARNVSAAFAELEWE